MTEPARPDGASARPARHRETGGESAVGASAVPQAPAPPETPATPEAPAAPAPPASTEKRGAGRPRTAILSRGLILETGLRLLDARGPQGLGIRPIATELGVRPSALYNHVAGQAELVAGVRELVSAQIAVDMFAREPWDEALAAWARSYRDTFAAHTPTIALLALHPLAADSATSLMYDTVIAALTRAGWPGGRALSLVVALESFVLGSALDLAADDDMLDPGPRADVPAFAAAYRDRVAALAGRAERPAEAAFTLGLRALLAGFRAEFAALADGAPARTAV